MRVFSFIIKVLFVGVISVPVVAEDKNGDSAEFLEVKYLSENADKEKNYINLNILDLALKKSSRPYSLVVNQHKEISPRRLNGMVRDNSDEVNVIWRGSSPELEDSLLPVRVPIFRGLLAYWFMWVHNEELDQFSQVQTLEDLRGFNIAQGRGWVTIPNFESIGLTVHPGDYEHLPKMLAFKRVDFLPYPIMTTKSLFPDGPEKLGITNHKRVLLYMPHVMYFFVSRENQALHDALYDGLNTAIADGSYRALLTSHPSTRNLFKDFSFESSLLLEVPSKHLTPETQAALDKYGTDPVSMFGN